MAQEVYIGKSRRGKYHIVHERSDTGLAPLRIHTRSQEAVILYLHAVSWSTLLENTEFFSGVKENHKKAYFRGHHGGPHPLSGKDLESIFRETVLKLKPVSED